MMGFKLLVFLEDMFMKIDGSFECESRFTIPNQVYGYSKAKIQVQLFRSNTTVQESQVQNYHPI